MDMFNIGLPELLVIFFLTLLLFGGKRLPEVARSLGQAMRAFQEEAHKLRREIQQAEASAGAGAKGASQPSESPAEPESAEKGSSTTGQSKL
jgi:sec-independent protein translocase protein TatA